MSTNYQTSDPSVTVTRFWGGTDRGVCIQITGDAPAGSALEFHNFVQLTQAQARALAAELPTILALAYMPTQDDPHPSRPRGKASHA